MSEHAYQLALAAWELQACGPRLDNPVEGSSGHLIPFYFDSRRFLSQAGLRKLIAAEYRAIIKQERMPYDVIAGTAVGAIAPATTLADLLDAPLCYVPKNPKTHGLQRKIEGADVAGRTVLLIEDTITFGETAARAVHTLRQEGARCTDCLVLFDYGLRPAADRFAGRIPIGENSAVLQPPCMVRTILTYDALMKVGQARGLMTEAEVTALKEWRNDPLGGAERYRITS